jgi:hypothetical protein
VIFTVLHAMPSREFDLSSFVLEAIDAWTNLAEPNVRELDRNSCLPLLMLSQQSLHEPACDHVYYGSSLRDGGGILVDLNITVEFC